MILRKGAEGTLPLPTDEQIEVLMLLVAAAPDPDLRKRALETLDAWDHDEVARLVADPHAAPDVLHFAAVRVLSGHEELREALLRNPALPAEIAARLRQQQTPGAASYRPPEETAPQSQPELLTTPPEPATEPAESSTALPADSQDEEAAAVEFLAKLAAGAKVEDVTWEHIEVPPEAAKRDDELTQKDLETLIQKIQKMTVVQKIKAALTGNMETRSVLIRDSNKIVSRAVVQSPKITETEAENYAAAKNVSEEVLRLISMNRRFMRAYVVVRALVNNPRAPINVTLPLVIRLNDKDLKGLALNRNIPDVIRSTANKVIRQKEEASKVTLPRRH